MEALEVLMEEHEIILKAISILEESANKLERGQSIPDQFFVDFLDVIKKFADKCHHGKEETVLFPLIKEKDAKQSKVIAILLLDHQDARANIASLEKAVANNDSKGKITNAVSYSSKLKFHIEKENKLFPSWMSNLSDEEKELVFEKFEEIEEKVIGLGKHEEYAERIETLASKLK